MARKTLTLRSIERSGIIDENSIDDEPNNGRPKTRADCARVERPCRWLSCKYNLSLDISQRGSIVFTPCHANKKKPSCALDEAAEGPKTLTEIGDLLGLTGERVRQAEHVALAKLRAAGVMQDVDEKGTIDDTDYDTAPDGGALSALGLDDKESLPWLRKILSD